MKTINTTANSRRAFILAALLAIWAFSSFSQTTTSDQYSVVDRGPFYRVLQRTVSITDSVSGQMSQQVQNYTELEDGMHYLSNGVWAAAQDLIEVTPNGAQALYGQMTGQFNSDITTAGAISLTTMAGEVFQSHPIGLFYADSAYITNGLSLATFECFPLGSTNFLPMFAGTNSANDTWTFDPVWPQTCVCLDTNAMDGSVNNCYPFDCPNWPGPTQGFSTTDIYVNFCADDYSWSGADSNYFYFAWSDRFRTYGLAPKVRPDADVKLAKIKQ